MYVGPHEIWALDWVAVGLFVVGCALVAVGRVLSRLDLAPLESRNLGRN